MIFKEDPLQLQVPEGSCVSINSPQITNEVWGHEKGKQLFSRLSTTLAICIPAAVDNISQQNPSRVSKCGLGISSWRFTGMVGLARLQWLIFLAQNAPGGWSWVPWSSHFLNPSKKQHRQKQRPGSGDCQQKCALLFAWVSCWNQNSFKPVVYPGWIISLDLECLRGKKRKVGTCCKQFRFHWMICMNHL